MKIIVDCWDDPHRSWAHRREHGAPTIAQSDAGSAPCQAGAGGQEKVIVINTTRITVAQNGAASAVAYFITLITSITV